MRSLRVLPALSALFLLVLSPATSWAASASELATRADAAIVRLEAAAPEARELMSKASGVLVFPRVIKAGMGIGGEYGEGVLRVGGQPVEYYSTASASIGFQLGAQSKAQFILFMTDQSLADFRAARGWEVGVDGSVTLVKIGTGGSIDTTSATDPVIAFVLADRGLMYDLSLAGTKFTKIVKE
ncbi:MAG: YSC84-related protein [Pseudomonadales bacterium]|jgi:lipid-binding SYLF domain-containing protein|nr:YSC84-related protein [Pseudomonadales bacterium]